MAIVEPDMAMLNPVTGLMSAASTFKFTSGAFNTTECRWVRVQTPPRWLRTRASWIDFSQKRMPVVQTQR